MSTKKTHDKIQNKPISFRIGREDFERLSKLSKITSDEVGMPISVSRLARKIFLKAFKK
jgi:hypothetical protein